MSPCPCTMHHLHRHSRATEPSAPWCTACTSHRRSTGWCLLEPRSEICWKNCWNICWNMETCWNKNVEIYCFFKKKKHHLTLLIHHPSSKWCSKVRDLSRVEKSHLRNRHHGMYPLRQGECHAQRLNFSIKKNGKAGDLGWHGKGNHADRVGIPTEPQECQHTPQQPGSPEVMDQTVESTRTLILSPVSAYFRETTRVSGVPC